MKFIHCYSLLCIRVLKRRTFRIRLVDVAHHRARMHDHLHGAEVALLAPGVPVVGHAELLDRVEHVDLGHK